MPGADGPLTDDELHDLTGATTNLVLAAVDRDDGRAADIISTVGERFGHHGVLCMCDALANAAKEMVGMSGGPTRLLLTDARTGRPVEPSDAPPQTRPHVWALQFVSAWIGGGPAATAALFYAHLHDQKRTLANVAALVDLIGELGRAKLAAGGQEKV